MCKFIHTYLYMYYYKNMLHTRMVPMYNVYSMYYSLYTPMQNMVQTMEVKIQLSLKRLPDSMRFFHSCLAPGRASAVRLKLAPPAIIPMDRQQLLCSWQCLSGKRRLSGNTQTRVNGLDWLFLILSPEAVR